jgi:inosine-uridine nucleoside N-ribohydrolase
MDLIIETDLGRDPDDFFAICYLIAAGVNVRAILISPGDPDQVAIARLICDETGLQIPIGVGKPDRNKRSSGGVHYEILEKFSHPLEAKADGLGIEILDSVLRLHPDSEALVIGPATSLGSYLHQKPNAIKRATMQGGFLPYEYHRPARPLEKFEGQNSVATFNLNGDRPNGLNFLSADIGRRQMVGKNICHTVEFTKQLFHDGGVRNPRKYYRPRRDTKNLGATTLFVMAALYYFEKHSEKKFHDPTAACLHLHPEIGTWVRGRTVKMGSGWGTALDPEGDYILADVNYNALWSHLLGMR